MNSQVLSNGPEQVLRPVVPLALLGPVSGGALQFVIPDLQSKDKTHRQSTCSICHKSQTLRSTACSDSAAQSAATCSRLSQPPARFRHFLPSQLGESEPRGTESNVSPQTVILERSGWRLALVHYKSPAITAELSTFPEWVSLWALRAEGGEAVGWGGRRRHLTLAVEGGGLVLYRQGRPSCSHSKAPLSTSPQ